MKKLILGSLVLSSVLFGNESTNIIQTNAYGKKVVKEQNYKFEKEQYKNSYRDEAIFNYILYSQNAGGRFFKEGQKQIENIDIPSSKLVSLKTKELTNKKEEKGKENIELTSVVGYCNIKDDIHIGKQPASSYVTCNTNIGYLTVFGNLIPKNEISTLFFDPKYIELKNYRFEVQKGSITTNEARTSYNIATFVNDRKLAKIGYRSAIETTTITQGTTHEYLEALEKSKTEKKVEYIKTPDGEDYLPVQSEKTEKPEAKDYIVKAGIDIVAGIIKNTAEVFKADLPYLYEVKKNSKIFIDLKVNKKGKKI